MPNPPQESTAEPDLREASPPAATHRRRTARVRLWYAFRLVFGVAIVSYLLYRYDLGEVWSIIHAASPGYLALAWAASLTAMGALAFVWKLSLRPLHVAYSPWMLLKLQFQQRFFALFLPGAAADFIRLMRVIRPSGQPGLAVALIIFARMSVALCTFFVTACAIMLDSRFPWPQWKWLPPAIVLAYGLMLYLGTRRRLQALVFRRWDALPGRLRLPGVRRRLESYGQALATFSTTQLLLVFALGFLAQAAFVGEQFFVARAVGIDLPAITFGWVRAVVLLCMVIPITVSGLGLREASLTAVLALYGVDEQLALAQSLLFFAAIVFVKGLIGGMFELKDALAPQRSRHDLS